MTYKEDITSTVNASLMEIYICNEDKKPKGCIEVFRMCVKELKEYNEELYNSFKYYKKVQSFFDFSTETILICFESEEQKRVLGESIFSLLVDLAEHIGIEVLNRANKKSKETQVFSDKPTWVEEIITEVVTSPRRNYTCTLDTYGTCYGADDPEIEKCEDCHYRKPM